MLHVGNFTRALALAVLPVMLVSCTGRGERKIENMKKTVPVHGEVYVDGQPGQGVKVMLTPKESPGSSGPSADVGEDGTFHISTYKPNDGAPAGEYFMTFTYADPKAPLRIGPAEELDDFKGKYSDPKKFKHPLTVTEDAPEVDAGRIDLQK